MCKSQPELSARRLCGRARLHFNIPSVRKAGSLTKNSSATSLSRPALTVRSRACATSRGLNSPLAITRSTAGSAENRLLRLRFSSSRARTRSPLQMRCARKWLSSNNVSLSASTTRSFTIRLFPSANRFTKFKRRSSKQSGLSSSSS